MLVKCFNPLGLYRGDVHSDIIIPLARAPPIGVSKEKVSLTYNLFIHH